MWRQEMFSWQWMAESAWRISESAPRTETRIRRGTPLLELPIGWHLRSSSAKPFGISHMISRYGTVAYRGSGSFVQIIFNLDCRNESSFVNSESFKELIWCSCCVTMKILNFRWIFGPWASLWSSLPKWNRRITTCLQCGCYSRSKKRILQSWTSPPSGPENSTTLSVNASSKIRIKGPELRNCSQ